MMRDLFVAALTILAASSSLAQANDDAKFVSMFDGKTLTNWEGKPDGWWVEEGAITSQSTEANPCLKHHYLYWTGGEPADFVMRFKYKLIGGNSGIQFRSEKRPDFDTSGYQADMEAGQQWSGCLFQHKRGGVVMRGMKAKIAPDGSRKEAQFADPKQLQKVIRTEDWNEYQVTAISSKIVLHINGELMCEVDDQDSKQACRKGIIALQMHPGPPMHVQFKDIFIKVLD